MFIRRLALVNCHICPLKDACNIGDDRISYDFHNKNCNELAGNMRKISNKCPIKCAVEMVDSIVNKE